jgi:hypothetical protein
MDKLRKFLRKSERGQAIVIIAFAMIGLIGIVGLMTDGGVLLIEYAKLKRAIDSAAIASALQFRRGFTGADLATAAEEFLTLNQSDAYEIVVWRCKDPDETTMDDKTLPSDDGTYHDPDLCTLPLRKLLRIEALRNVRFGFMRVLGFDSATITASSVGEAASIDLVLVIDTSASMAYETYEPGNGNIPDHPSEDPSVCNFSADNPCQPLHDVKNVALDFMDTMFFPYDRVSVVAMTSQEPDGTRDHVTLLPLSDDEAEVRTAIGNLKVHQPPICVPGEQPTPSNPSGTPAAPEFGTCLNYNDEGTFIGLECPLFRHGLDLIPLSGDEVMDISSCNSSNIGGALFRAAGEFTREPVRDDSFWVVIALAGGPANATDSAPGFLHGYCPPSTWNDPVNPFCRDASAASRHSNGNPNYDADDYARDMADFLADPVDGQGVTVFTIGLGNLVQNASKGDPDAGEKLLIYIAESAGSSTGVTANHGFYSFAPDPSDLDEIFARIASNIFTRISK